MKIRSAAIKEGELSIKRGFTMKALASALFGMALALTGNAFTLYDSNMEGYDKDFNFPVPPAADYDIINTGDFSDCINAQGDHWAWPVNGGQITINYWFDSTFDGLFAVKNGAVETAVKAQILQAMNQWTTASSTAYGTNDSYARTRPLTWTIDTLTEGNQQQLVQPFMDVRSATLHELGHVLGLAHCDEGVAAGRNYAYFDAGGNRGTGLVGSGNLELYGTGPNIADVAQNYYTYNIYHAGGYVQPAGSWGQEVMSQYSSQSEYAGTQIFGRQPGEINHILSWDELDAYYFLYGKSKLVFTNAANEGSANLVFYGGPIYNLTNNVLDTKSVCQALPLGVPKIPGDPTQGIVIQQAQITFNSGSTTKIGYATAGFNFDVQANTGWNIYSVALDVVGTENTNLVGPTFDNFGYYQGNPAYQFQPGVPFYPGDTGLKDKIGVRWSHSPSPIPSGTLLHVGVTPDIWDWTDFGVNATFFDNHVPIPNQMTVATAPVHVYRSPAGIAAGFADAAGPHPRVTGACLTTTATTNVLGVDGLAVTGPATTNSTLLFNLQVADVTGMGLTLSNLSSIELAQLQASNQMISISNFGTNTLNKGETFVVVLQGDTNDLPADIVTNNRYAMDLNLSNLVNRELFAVVSSSDGNSLVRNYSLLNAPSSVATVQSNLNLTSPNITSANRLGSGAFQLGVYSTNVPPLYYVVSSTNLTLPLADWTIRGIATNSGPGQYQFTDTNTTDRQRFYWIRWMLTGAR